MKIAIRVDVDTFRGTRRGVPTLLKIMAKHNVRAAYFFSVGPDNMGRNLWRLLKPVFLWKMLRTKAASLYGLDILLMGTCWPGPKIGKHNESVIRDCVKDGHEFGLHAWDHYTWQNHIASMPREIVAAQLKLAYAELVRIAGTEPVCSATPGWKSTDDVLLAKEEFHFKYNSDCRGSGIFMPSVNGTTLTTPQIPLNMPTYDEILGRDGITNENYNERLLSFADPDQPNLLTIHAEAEGGACAEMFDKFLSMAKAKGVEFCAPGDLIPQNVKSLPVCSIKPKVFPGRDGWMAAKEE